MLLSLTVIFGTALFPFDNLAYAEKKPKPIDYLDYNMLQEPPEGMHHYLMACVDNWHGNANNLGNTDGVIMVTMDTVNKRILFTSFLREMLVERPQGGAGRITYIAKNHGIETFVKIISEHFGVKLENYIIFDMDAVQTIIDAMGGVYITVTDDEADYLNRYRISRDSTTPSMDKGGTYLFSGHAAVIYMRIRKVGGDGDMGRNRRMRTVLVTLTGQLKNISFEKALSILQVVTGNNLVTNMSMPKMLSAVQQALSLREVTPENIQMPPSEAITPINYAGMMTQEVDFAYARKVLNDFIYKVK